MRCAKLIAWVVKIVRYNAHVPILSYELPCISGNRYLSRSFQMKKSDLGRIICAWCTILRWIVTRIGTVYSLYSNCINLSSSDFSTIKKGSDAVAIQSRNFLVICSVYLFRPDGELARTAAVQSSGVWSIFNNNQCTSISSLFNVLLEQQGL